MSHYHLEIVIPPVGSIEYLVKEALAGFNEDVEDGAEPPANAFYDWYAIGGRWHAEKMICAIPPERLDAFYTEVEKQKVMVKRVVCGKQTLVDPHVVDEIWLKMFPDLAALSSKCPLFDHARDQYSRTVDPLDVCRVSEVPPKLTAARLIVVEPNDLKHGWLVSFMIQKETWNGFNLQKSDWDGNVKEGIERSRIDGCVVPDDWRVVTVDYHV